MDKTDGTVCRGDPMVLLSQLLAVTDCKDTPQTQSVGTPQTDAKRPLIIATEGRNNSPFPKGKGNYLRYSLQPHLIS